LRPIQRDLALPRLVLDLLAQPAPPPMKLMFGDSFLSTKMFRP
jgi:hypothetical protein